MASFSADVKRPNYMWDKKRPISCLISINILKYAAGKTAFFTLFPVMLLCYDETQQGNEEPGGTASKPPLGQRPLREFEGRALKKFSLNILSEKRAEKKPFFRRDSSFSHEKGRTAMFRIVNKKELNSTVTLLEIEAPFVARKAQAGQFIIFRVDEMSERVPLTIADYDREKGTVTIIFQKVGLSTKLLGAKEIGDSIQDFVGPLGVATEYEGMKKVAVVGGGVGCAIAYPQAKALHALGVEVDVIAGFRSKDIVILEDEMKAVSSNFYLMTDDGTQGEKGFVTDKLKTLIEGGAGYDTVIAIGPIPMMKFVSLTTKPYGIKTIVSLNPIMIDGTGMCGGCRVTVGGKIKFACVDGPDFDGHEVDFDELMNRNSVYKAREAELAETHICRMEKLAQELI